jgi:hydroxyethylthiazole kinase-like sugar kinase family protein
MKKWENYFYAFAGASLGALGLLFMILGAGCLVASFTAFVVAIKRRTGFQLF